MTISRTASADPYYPGLLVDTTRAAAEPCGEHHAFRDGAPTPVPGPTQAPGLLTVPGAGDAPARIAIAGVYDDVNGDGRKEFADVVRLVNRPRGDHGRSHRPTAAPGGAGRRSERSPERHSFPIFGMLRIISPKGLSGQMRIYDNRAWSDRPSLMASGPGAVPILRAG